MRSAARIRFSSSSPVPAAAGSHARSQRAAPECLAALRYVLVERSPSLRGAPARDPADRAGRRGARSVRAARAPRRNWLPCRRPVRCSHRSRTCPEMPVDTFVLANELLDNLPFGIAQWDGARWDEVRVAVDGSRFVEILVPASDSDAAALTRVVDGRDLPPRTRLPIPRGVEAWLDECGQAMHTGVVVLLDYFIDVDELLARGGDWLRTFRGHRTGIRPARRAGQSGHHHRRAARPASSTRPRRRVSRSSTTARRPNGCATSASTSSSPTAGARGTRARHAATSSRSPDAAESRKVPRSPTPPDSARTVSSRWRSRPGPRRPNTGSLGRDGGTPTREGNRHGGGARGTAPGGSDVLAFGAIPQGRADRGCVGLRRRRNATGRATGPPRRSHSTGSRSGTPSSSGTSRSRSGSSAESSTSRTTASTGTSKPVTATRSRTTGKANPATRARITYRELLDESSRVANLLKSLGIEKGDRVAIYMGMVPELPSPRSSRAPASARRTPSCSVASPRCRCATASTMPKPRC